MAQEMDVVQGQVARYIPQLPADLSALTRPQLVDLGRQAEQMQQAVPWVLGDLACQVQTSYGEADLEKYAAEIGVAYSTLRDYKSTSEAFPAQSVARATHSWTVYRTLAAQEDRLELVTGAPMTAQQAKELVWDRQAKAAAREHRKELREQKKAREEAKRNKDSRHRKPAAAPEPPRGPAVIPGTAEPVTDTTTGSLPAQVSAPAQIEDHLQRVIALLAGRPDVDPDRDRILAAVQSLVAAGTDYGKRTGPAQPVNGRPVTAPPAAGGQPDWLRKRVGDL